MQQAGKIGPAFDREVKMNLFERFFRITHYRDPRKWIETEGIFTGKSETAVVRTRVGPRKANYRAYEVAYYANGNRLHGWYTFHPLPDPEPKELAGKKIRIRYKKRKPYIFEKVTA